MKKLILIALLFVSFEMNGQVATKYAAERFVTNQQLTASTGYVIEISGGNYFWDITAFWSATSRLTTSYIKVQESTDGVKWVNCAVDSLTLVIQPGFMASLQDDRMMKKYLRAYFKVTSGDTIKGLNCDYTFKQR